MSPTPARRVALGFQGGQVLALRVPDEVLETLRQTLKDGRERWIVVHIEVQGGPHIGSRQGSHDRSP